MEQGVSPRNTLDVWLWNQAQNCGTLEQSRISGIGPEGSVALLLSTQWPTAPNNRRQQIEAAAASREFGRTKALPQILPKTVRTCSFTMADDVRGAASKDSASPSPPKKYSHPLDPLDADEVLDRSSRNGSGDR